MTQRDPLRVTIWHEHRHEQQNPDVAALYPDGMHTVMRDGLAEQLGEAVKLRTVTLDDEHQGLSDDVLSDTDVMLWWGHIAHDEVAEENVDRVQRCVLDGMGLIVLHSGHHSKIFRRLMGTGCGLRYRIADEHERLWVVNPGHPIADGLGDYFELDKTEMYGELFDVPPPDELVLISWFPGGEVFRSGCCWTRGKGRIFYFRPGHETYPIYYDANVRRVIANAVKWAAPASSSPYALDCPRIDDPLEPLD